MTMLWVLLGIFVLAVAFVIASYNRLVRLRNRVKNAFAQIDVQLQRRYDLIPNLVETAKAYMKHERETLEAITRARAAAVDAHRRAAHDPADAKAMQTLMRAEKALAEALGRLQVVVESYPELKADANMRALMEELATTENRVAFARQAYNDAVMAYNTRRESFPDNLIAAWFGFAPAQMYEMETQAARRPVRVSFD